MDVVELSKELISYNTQIPPGNEEQCARFLRDYIRDMHFKNCALDVHRFQKSRANLIAKIGPDRPGLLLSGHIDVVPTGEVGNWSSPPFEAKVKGGRLFGRGAADMKAGVAAMVKAIESMKRAKLNRGIVFIATAGEEADYDGLKSIVREKKLTGKEAKFGLIAEPTELNVVHGHRGATTFALKFHGRSAHASEPESGINAVENCSNFISDSDRWRKIVSEARDPDLGSSTLTATVIKGGTKSNVIPDYCELAVDCRRIPKHTMKKIQQGIVSIIKKRQSIDPNFRVDVQVMTDSDPLALPRDHHIVKLAEKCGGGESTIAPYGTEAPFYVHLGIPVVILGPGSVKQAHITDEYVELREVRKAVSIYE